MCWGNVYVEHCSNSPNNFFKDGQSQPQNIWKPTGQNWAWYSHRLMANKMNHVAIDMRAWTISPNRLFSLLFVHTFFGCFYCSRSQISQGVYIHELTEVYATSVMITANWQPQTSPKRPINLVILLLNHPFWIPQNLGWLPHCARITIIHRNSIPHFDLFWAPVMDTGMDSVWNLQGIKGSQSSDPPTVTLPFSCKPGSSWDAHPAL